MFHKEINSTTIINNGLTNGTANPNQEEIEDIILMAGNAMQQSNTLLAESDKVELQVAEKNLQASSALLKTLEETTNEEQKRTEQVNKRVNEMVDEIKAKRARMATLRAEVNVIKNTLAENGTIEQADIDASSAEVKQKIGSYKKQREKHKSITHALGKCHTLFTDTKTILEKEMGDFEARIQRGEAALSQPEPIAITKTVFSFNSKS